MKITIPTVAVIDHRAGRVTLDGVDIAPGTAIAEDPTVEVLGRSLAQITVGLYAENVLIVTDQGASSPTATAEAHAIVRSGLRDVLDWLGEGDSPCPDAEMAGGDDDAEWTESLDELRAERDRFLDLAEQAGWTIRKFLEQRDEARAAAKKLGVALDRERAKVERVREIAEGWRYKGEFGWGPWQIGEGPDPDGYVLDHAAGKIRAALSAGRRGRRRRMDAREAIERARGGR